MISQFSTNYKRNYYWHSIPISWYFILIGTVNGTWISRLPEIKTMDHLSNSSLGFALLFAAIGGLLSFPIVAKLNQKCGSAKALLIGSVYLCLTTPAIGLNNLTLGFLTTAMFSIGCALALTDISMTTQAIILEKSYKVSFMGYCMAMISIGNFSGSIIGGIFVYFNFTPYSHFSMISYIALFFSIVFYMFLFNKDIEDEIHQTSISNITYSNNTNNNNNHHEENNNQLSNFTYISHNNSDSHAIDISDQSKCPDSEKVSNTNSMDHTSFTCNNVDNNSITQHHEHTSNTYLKNLAVLAFLAQIGEGVISDWSTLYFREVLQSSPSVSTMGFTVFALSMAIGRFNTDRLLNNKHSNMSILKGSGFLSFVGLCIVVVSPSLPAYDVSVLVALFGLCISGFGLSMIFPIVASCSGNIPGTSPSDSIATVTSAGYLGFLVGPPFFGYVSDLLHNLRWSLLIGAFLLLLVGIVPWTVPATTASSSVSIHSSPITSPNESVIHHNIYYSERITTPPTPSLRRLLSLRNDRKYDYQSIENLNL